jgi:hypothetical protein
MGTARLSFVDFLKDFGLVHVAKQRRSNEHYCTSTINRQAIISLDQGWVGL